MQDRRRRRSEADAENEPIPEPQRRRRAGASSSSGPVQPPAAPMPDGENADQSSAAASVQDEDAEGSVRGDSSSSSSRRDIGDDDGTEQDQDNDDDENNDNNENDDVVYDEDEQDQDDDEDDQDQDDDEDDQDQDDDEDDDQDQDFVVDHGPLDRGPLQEAMRSGDVAKVQELLDAGVDPFAKAENVREKYRIPFHAAVASRDIQMLTLLAADPGTKWVDRFLICKNDVVRVPEKGRTAILSQTDIFATGGGFRQQANLSLECLEINLIYGYKINGWDIPFILYGVLKNQWGLKGRCSIKVLKLALAALSFDAHGHVTDEVKLDYSLGEVVQDDHYIAELDRNAPRYEVAQMLLQAGADPNAYCRDLDYSPALFGAVKYGNVRLARLLLAHGAKINLTGNWLAEPFNEWDRNSVYRPRSGTIFQCASGNEEMIKLLSSSVEKVPLDVERYVSSLRRELTSGYRDFFNKHKCSESLVVACMRTTGTPLPVGFASNIVSTFLFLDIGEALWGAKAIRLQLN